MQISIRENGDVTVVEIVGQLDAATAPAAQARVLAAVQPAGRMILDMHGVSFMASAGVRILLMTYRTITAKGGQVALARLPDTLKDLLSNIGFLDLFPHHDAVEAALAALTRHGTSAHGNS